MAERLWKMISGYAMIRVDGMAPERFIDHCRRCGIPLWFVKRVSRVSISARLPFSMLSKAEQAAKAVRCNLVVEQPSRSVCFRQSLFKRKALLLSLTAAVLLMGVASRFVWGVSVTGAITPQMKENVFQTLEELRISRGTRWAMIDSAAIENSLRLNTQGVQMAIVHRNGLFLELEIIPAVEPPEWETDQTACDIVSMRSAVIESVIALEGTPMVKPGDRVLPGDMLIRGTYRRGEEEGKQRFVRAKGSVMGRVSYAGQAGAALQYQSFITSGRTAVVRTLVLGSLRIALSSQPAFDRAEVGAETKTVVGGTVTPVYVSTQVHHELVPITCTRTYEQAQTLAASIARSRAIAQLPPGTEVSQERVVSELDKDGIVQTTVFLTVIMEIGSVREPVLTDPIL